MSTKPIGFIVAYRLHCGLWAIVCLGKLCFKGWHPLLSDGVFYSVLNLERCKLNLTASAVSWAMVVFTTAAVGRSETDRIVARL